MKRAHINELAITRALAILAVLLIHSTSTPVTALSSDSKLYPFYVFFNISLNSLSLLLFFKWLCIILQLYTKGFNKGAYHSFYKKSDPNTHSLSLFLFFIMRRCNFM